MVATDPGDVEIGEAIAIDVGDTDPDAPAGVGDPGACGTVLEGKGSDASTTNSTWKSGVPLN